MASRKELSQVNDNSSLGLANPSQPSTVIQGKFPTLANLRAQDLADLIGGSPLDRPLKTTLFVSTKGRNKGDSETSLRELAASMGKVRAASKDKLPLIKLARFGDMASPKGSLRHDGNVLAFEGIEGDYDAGKVTMTEAAKRLRSNGIAALLYASPSHTAGNPRWRVLCPCSMSLPPDNRAALVARLNGSLGGVLAGESFTLSQSFYLGGIAGRPAPKSILVDGRYIDLATDLDAKAIGRRKADPATGEVERDESGSGAAFRKAVSLHLAGQAIGEFEAWATENPWKDYDADPERATERTWERAAAEAGKIALNDRRDAADMFDDEGPEPGPKSDSSGFQITWGHEITPQAVDWIWKGYLARGKGTLLTGLPGGGKSTTTIDIAARISKGAAWPDGGAAPKGSVFILASEDAANDTILPRLMAAGANLNNVGFIPRTVVTGKSGTRSFNLQEDLAKLAKAIRSRDDATLVIIDPITAYMGKNVDSHKTADVRAVLDGVSMWAEDLGIAVLAITHPSKSVTSAMNAATGSQAFVAFFRLNFLASVHPEDIDKPPKDQRAVLAPIKINIGAKPPSLSYHIQGKTVTTATGVKIETSRIEWGESSDIQADELLNARNDRDRKPVRKDEAGELLQRLFQDFDAPEPGEGILARKIEDAALADGITERTLQRAKSRLGIVTRKVGAEWRCFWPM